MHWYQLFQLVWTTSSYHIITIFTLSKVRNRREFNKTLHWAICVPSTCSNKDAEYFLHAIFSSVISHHNVSVVVPQIKCHVEEPAPLTKLEIVYGWVITVGFCLWYMVIEHVLTCRDYERIHRAMNNVNAEDWSYVIGISAYTRWTRRFLFIAINGACNALYCWDMWSGNKEELLLLYIWCPKSHESNWKGDRAAHFQSN